VKTGRLKYKCDVMAAVFARRSGTMWSTCANGKLKARSQMALISVVVARLLLLVLTARGWWRCSGRTSVPDRRTFSVLLSTYSCWAGQLSSDNFVGKVSAIGQPTTLTQPFIFSG